MFDFEEFKQAWNPVKDLSSSLTNDKVIEIGFFAAAASSAYMWELFNDFLQLQSDY